jgi:hypothetical protein
LSPAVEKDTTERRLGRGRNAPRRRGREDGRTRPPANARRTPSTAATRASGLAAGRRRIVLSPLDAGAGASEEVVVVAGRRRLTTTCPLCRAQRKEPGCVVGEHAHALFRGGPEAAGSATRRTDGAPVGARGLTPRE